MIKPIPWAMHVDGARVSRINDDRHPVAIVIGDSGHALFLTREDALKLAQALVEMLALAKAEKVRA